MTTLSFERPTYTLPKYYDRQLVRNIWRALRSERGRFLGGRTPFASFVHDEVLTAFSKAVIRTSDGVIYSAPDGGIEGKTIDNFIQRCSSIFSSDSIEKTTPLNTANQTLQYLHLFLWQRHPDRVNKWTELQSPLTDDLIIKGLDDTFRIFETLPMFPTGVIFHSSENVVVKDVVDAAEDYYNSDESIDFQLPNDEYEGSEILGALLISRIKGEVLNRCIWINADLLKLLKVQTFENGDIIEPQYTGEPKADLWFQLNMGLRHGRTVSIKTKNLITNGTPHIADDQCAVVVKTSSKMRTGMPFMNLSVEKLQPATEFHKNNTVEGASLFHAAMYTRIQVNEHIGRCLPIHLSESASQYLHQICTIMV